MAEDQADTTMMIQSMSADEQRGFIYACEVIHTWARQIERHAPALQGADIEIPLELQVQNSARFAQGLAAAMRRQALK